MYVLFFLLQDEIRSFFTEHHFIAAAQSTFAAEFKKTYSQRS